MKQCKFVFFRYPPRRVTEQIGVVLGTAMILLGLVPPCLAQAVETQTTAVGQPGDQGPAYTKVTRIPDDALEPRPSTLILPSDPLGVDEERLRQSGGTIGFVPTESHRLPEGYVVAGRTGQIEVEDKWLIAHLDDAEGLPKAPPLRILPNRQLSLIEAILAHAKASPTFVMTGRITEFQGVNYLLLDNIVEQPKAAPPAEPEKPAVPEPPVGEMSSPSQPVREPSPEEIIGELMKKKPLRSVVLPGPASPETAPESQARPKPSEQAEAGATTDSLRWPENTMLINRSGRIIPAESGYMLSFEDQGLNPKDTPIRLLPNRMLETAVALSAGGSKGVVFIVSGEVTAHRGTNYLLLRKVLVRRNLGNLH